MVEILAISFFSKKIRTIAEQKNIDPSKWIWRMVITWFAVEIITVVLYFVFTQNDFEDGILIVIPAMILAIISAFYTVNQLEKEPEIISDSVKINSTAV